MTEDAKQEKTEPKRRQYYRDRYARCKAKGICLICGKPRADGKSMCKEHNEKAYQYYLTHKGEILAKKKERRKTDFCPYCSDLKVEGKAACAKHLAYQRKYQQNNWRKYKKTNKNKELMIIRATKEEKEKEGEK